MRIQIGTVDGQTHSSDPFTREELQAYIDEADGKFGTGTLSSVVINTPEELLEMTLDFFKYDRTNEYQICSLRINGHDRTFNSRHVVWWELLDE